MIFLFTKLENIFNPFIVLYLLIFVTPEEW